MSCLCRVLVYAIPLLVGTYAAFRPTLDTGFERMQADTGDTLLNHYTLEHLHRCLTDRGYCGQLLSPPFYFPQPLVLAYSENFLGGLPLYSALRAFLVEDLAYQAWMILLAMLNYLAMAVVCRWLGCPAVVAAFAAFLWAFGLPHVVQIRHQQLLARFAYPFAAYYAWRLAIAPSLRSLNCLAAATFCQLVCCIYTGWFLAFSMAFFLPAAIALHRGGGQCWIRFLRQQAARIIAITALWILSIGLFVSPYLHANSDLTRTYEECTYYLPTLASWFHGPEGSFWYHTFALLREEVDRENTLFSGLVLLILALGATLRVLGNWPSGRASPKWVLTAAGLITSGLLVLMTFNLKDGVSGWQLVRWLPGGGASVSSAAFTFPSIFTWFWRWRSPSANGSPPVPILGSKPSDTFCWC